MCRPIERTLEHNERVLIASLLMMFIGVPMLLTGAMVYAPTNHLWDDDSDLGLELNSIGIMSGGGGLLLSAFIMFAVAVVRYPVLLSKYFSFGSLRSDVLYMVYSFAALCCWLALVFATALLGDLEQLATCSTTTTCAYVIMAVVFISTSPIPILSFFFFAVRALRRFSKASDGHEGELQYMSL